MTDFLQALFENLLEIGKYQVTGCIQYLVKVEHVLDICVAEKWTTFLKFCDDSFQAWNKLNLLQKPRIKGWYSERDPSFYVE